MNLQLHKNARTSPAIRRELQAQPASITNKELADLYHLNRHTVAKWRKRQGTAEASSRPHTIHANLSPAQEQITVALRTNLLLPLDDLLAVTHEFLNTTVSRSGLSRCLRRHNVSNLNVLREQLEPSVATAKPKPFKNYEPGFVHVDIKYLPKMPDEPRHKYLFAAIDRSTRWVYVEIHDNKSAQTANEFLSRLIDKAPFTINKILTDNGKEFTDRFCATGERQPTGRHPFDKTCQVHNIVHRLIKPRHPQTNGMIERFNGRIAEILNTYHFDSSQTLSQTILRYVRLYNHAIPQKSLGHLSPMSAMQQWQQKTPHRFKELAYNLTEPDMCRIP